MQRIKLGRSDLDVSRICFGTWQLSGDWGSLDEQENVAAMQRALELGVNFFDTAQAYGFGASEQLVHKALGDELRSRRDEIVLATKGGLRMTEDGLERDSSPQWLRQGVEDSLGYLGVDHIDLYQIHWPDPDTPSDETAGALSELAREGKIRHVGVSNFDVEEMRGLEGGIAVETLQPPYHLFRRDIEQDVLPYCPRARHRPARLRAARARIAVGQVRPRHPARRGRLARLEQALPGRELRAQPRGRRRSRPLRARSAVTPSRKSPWPGRWPSPAST
jgi:Predicted oxidoreductases (related to aryl-alcohol dehydrogenases)